MSDAIKHECGLAYIRLLKPFSYYQQKKGTALYGLNKLYLLMEIKKNKDREIINTEKVWQDGISTSNTKLAMDIEFSPRRSNYYN